MEEKVVVLFNDDDDYKGTPHTYIFIHTRYIHYNIQVHTLLFNKLHFNKFYNTEDINYKYA